MYSSVAEGGGRGASSGLRLEGRVCSMLTVMLGGDFFGLGSGLGLGLGFGLGVSQAQGQAQAKASAHAQGRFSRPSE